MLSYWMPRPAGIDAAIAKYDAAHPGPALLEQPEATPEHAPAHAPSPPLIYDLAGVLVHSGGAFGGHYYAFLKARLPPTPLPPPREEPSGRQRLLE